MVNVNPVRTSRSSPIVGRISGDAGIERPERFKDRYLDAVDSWRGGCLYCGCEPARATLAGSDGRLTMPLCPKHTRWAMACRRERVGKQARKLKLLLLAWCRLKGDDTGIAREWLGF